MTQSPSFRRKPLPIERKPKNVTLNLSSSSDEFPELNTAQINDQDSIQFENESEYESYSYEMEEMNWKSNKSADHNVNSVRHPNTIQRGQNSINQRGRRPIPKRKPQTKNQNEHKSQDQKSDLNQIQSKSIQIQPNQEENHNETKQDKNYLQNNEKQENYNQTQEQE